MHRELKGVLEFTEQPTERGRFRYAKERRRTPLPGRKDGSFPAVRVTAKFRDVIPDGTHVHATVVTRRLGEDGVPRPHWHRLEGRNGESVSQPLSCGAATFGNLVIIRSDRTVYENQVAWGQRPLEDQQVIRIMFTVMFRTPSGDMARSWVVSDPIYGCELKIQNLSHRKVRSLSASWSSLVIPMTLIHTAKSWVTQVSMEMGEELILLTSKIKRQNTELMVVDKYRDHPFPSDSIINETYGWRCDRDGNIYCVIEPSHVHHQYGLVARMPPYWDREATDPRPVTVRLVDNAQQMESSPRDLAYIPDSK